MVAHRTTPTPQTGLKNPYAVRGGRLVHISDLTSPGLQPNCLCPCCERPLVAKLGAVRAHHFAHLAEGGMVPCSGESILHKLAKDFLADRVERCLHYGGEFWVRWRCKACGQDHEEDLIAGVGHFALEHTLADGAARADLALLDHERALRRVVEIVVAHAPAPPARAAYQALAVRLFELDLTDFDDLEALRGEGTLAVRCTDCLDLADGGKPRCGDCGGVLCERRVFVVEAACEGCGSPMKVTLIQRANGTKGGAEALGRRERRLATEAGARIQPAKGPLHLHREWADHCGVCQVFTDPLFESSHWRRFDPARTAPVASQLVCPACEPRR